MTNFRLQSSDRLELVLGGGGIKGFGHLGVLKALSERRVRIGRVTGVSVGAIIAALFTNGMAADTIEDLFFERLPERFNPWLWLRSLAAPDLTGLMFGSIFDLLPATCDFVSRNDLTPRPNLRIVAYDVTCQQPVLFDTGKDYNLAVALAASCALPGVFRPVRTRERQLLVDGALYHRNPTEFCDGPALVSRLGLASQLPSEILTPVDMWYHLREMYVSQPEQRHDVDDSDNLLVHLETPDIAGLSFGRSQEVLLSMVDNGYRTASRILDAAIRERRLPLR